MSFVPNRYKIPVAHQTRDFFFAPLNESLVRSDYEAVCASLPKLRHIFRPNDSWPDPNISLEQNYRDLVWHREEFEHKRSFAYAVLSSDRTDYLGCVYLYPSRTSEYDVEVFLWIRSDRPDYLEHQLRRDTGNWLHSHWPFRHPVFPGRSIAWTDWQLISSQPYGALNHDQSARTGS